LQNHFLFTDIIVFKSQFHQKILLKFLLKSNSNIFDKRTKHYAKKAPVVTAKRRESQRLFCKTLMNHILTWHNTRQIISVPSCHAQILVRSFPISRTKTI